MLIAVAGDLHGKIDLCYEEVQAFSKQLNRKIDLLLQVGDFGIWPDPNHIDKPTRQHGGAGDFPRWWAEKKAAPIPTCFIKGNHEDFGFLEALNGRDLHSMQCVLRGLEYIRNGAVRDITTNWITGSVRVAALGGCYAESDSDVATEQFRKGSPAHYSRNELDFILAQDKRDVDILLLHDAPEGIEMPARGKRPSYVTRGPGLRSLVETLKPKVVFFGHHHAKIRTELFGIPVFGLNLIGREGWLVAWDTETGFVG